jgi:hypothetical protein
MYRDAPRERCTVAGLKSHTLGQAVPIVGTRRHGSTPMPAMLPQVGIVHQHAATAGIGSALRSLLRSRQTRKPGRRFVHSSNGRCSCKV